MKKTALMIMILTIIAKLFGFLRDITLSYYYGASEITDAYLISTTIPLILFSLFSAAIGAGFIPTYNRIIRDKGEADAKSFTNALLTVLLLVNIVFMIIILVFTESVVLLFASGFTGTTLNMAILFTKITIFSLIIQTFISVFSYYLHLKRVFWIQPLLGIPLNLVIITGIVISSKIDNPNLLAISYLFGILIQFIILLPFIIKNNFKYKMNFNLTDEGLKLMLLIVFPIFLSVASGDINKIVDRTLASRLTVGGVSALNYANQLNQLIKGIITFSITTAMYPLMSKYASNNKREDFLKVLNESMNLSLVLTMPLILIFTLYSKDIVTLFYGRGAFSDVAIQNTSVILVFYTIGLLFSNLKQILSRAYYSLEKVLIPVITSVLSMIVNIILNLLFFYQTNLGLAGLALSTSIASIINMLLLFILFHTYIPEFKYRKIFVIFGKTIIAIMIMTIIGWGADYILSFSILHSNIKIIINLIIQLPFYFIVLLLLKVEEVDIFFNQIKKLISRNNS